jgi:hypothetical protein
LCLLKTLITAGYGKVSRSLRSLELGDLISPVDPEVRKYSISIQTCLKMLEAFEGILSIKQAAKSSAIYAVSPLKESLLQRHSGLYCNEANAMDAVDCV